MLDKEDRKMATISDKNTVVGIIGMGIMGSAFASNLLSKGYEVHVYNRTREKAQPLIDKGAQFHATPRDLAAISDILMTSLTDQNAIESVALGDNGFLAGMTKGKLWIDLSTIDPAASVRHADLAKRAGIERLDTPVVGSKEAALSGKVIVLVGGDEDVFKKAKSFLGQIGKTVIYLGDVGNGHKMKLAVNLYLGLVAVSFSESMALARKLGLEERTYVDTINQTAHRNYFTEDKGPKIVARDFEPAFSLDNILKDLRLVHEQAKRTGALLPLTDLATKQYADAVSGGEGSEDFSIIAMDVLRKNGVE
jgi:3-hydroxyisobutyrate dehydrogenase-like beta-hydroxyacid dehydrogenase